MPIDPNAAAAGSAGSGRTTDDDDDRRGARGGNGGGSGGPTDTGRADARKMIQRFRGRTEDALAEMFDETKELRTQRRELREELAKFKAPGVVALTADEAKEWQAYVALGKPADIKTKVEGFATLEQKVAMQDRRTAADTAAKALGWNSEALASMIIDKKLNVSFVDGQDAQGKAVKIPHVRPEGADDKTASTPLKDWQAANAAYLTPSLSAKSTADGTGTPANAAGGTRTGGTLMVDQGSAAAGTAPGAGGTRPGQLPGRANYQTPGQRAAAK